MLKELKCTSKSQGEKKKDKNYLLLSKDWAIVSKGIWKNLTDVESTADQPKEMLPVRMAALSKLLQNLFLQSICPQYAIYYLEVHELPSTILRKLKVLNLHWKRDK